MRARADKSTKPALFAVAAISLLFLAPTGASAFQQDPPIAIDASEAFAPTVLNTSGLYSDSGSSYPACVIANLSTVSVDVEVDLIDATGAVLYTTGVTPFAITAGTIREFLHTGYTGYSRCRFTVYANPNKIRASSSIYHLNGAYYETLAADDAR